ncbi:MAG: oxidoreductase [Sphingomonadales bacterium]|nr:oxidoreductase [Sphingomonadales bacterium]MDE2169176.1 oxidoreductase [Sphingomonadales bacterium]
MTIDPSAPLRTGIIGYGLAGRVFHAPLVRAARGLRLTAIATSRADEVAALGGGIRAIADPQELIDAADIDLVIIASPTGTHADLARAALMAGKAVVVDKPFTLTLAEARDLAALAQAKDGALLVFHNRRWDSCFLSIRDAIESGEIGRVTRFMSHFDRFRPNVRERWREDGTPGSGLLYDLGPHLIDQALMLFGMPQTVSADIAALREGSRSVDDMQITLRYPAMRVQLCASMNAPDASGGGAPRFTVHGTKGTLVKRLLDPQEDQAAVGLRPGDEGWGVDADPLAIHDAQGGVTLRAARRGAQESFYAMLAAHLAGKGPPPVTLTECVAVMEVIEAAQLSAEQQRGIALPLPLP